MPLLFLRPEIANIAVIIKQNIHESSRVVSRAHINENNLEMTSEGVREKTEKQG